MQVEWRVIPSAPGYEASSAGQIRRRGRVLVQQDNGHGYKRLKISICNKQSDAYVHRLVCEAFHGEQPPNSEVRHLDGQRDNNISTNLAWASKAENEADKLLHGTSNWGERNGHARLSIDDVHAIRARARAGERLEKIAADYGVSRACVGDAVAGRRWRRLPGAPGPRRVMLTQEQVRAIRARVASGERKVDVARSYGVRWGTVNRIVVGARHASK